MLLAPHIVRKQGVEYYPQESSDEYQHKRYYY